MLKWIGCGRKAGQETFKKILRPVWEKARQMGLTEKEISAIVEEARAKDRTEN